MAGDVVNTAARLQSAAPVDGVLVGEVTYRAAEREIVFEAHEPIDAKGKAEPVACWIAVEPRSFVPIASASRSRSSAASASGGCWSTRSSTAGPSASVQLVTIVGVPGIGKSRLVEELGAYLEADPELTTWRHGHVLSYGTGVAFFALAEIVKQECGILDSDDVLVAGRSSTPRSSALGLEGTDALGPQSGRSAGRDRRRGRRLGPVGGVRRLATLLRGHGCAVADGDDRRRPALGRRRAARFRRRTRRPGPRRAAARGGDGAARAARASARLGPAGRLNSLTIGLGPLSTEHTTALIDEIIDRSLLPVDAEAVLLERAGGNPLYAQEYVRALVERGAGAELPETVQGIIAARLDGLSADEKSLLQDAAVIGPTVVAGGGVRARVRDRSDTDELMLRLERKQLVYRARRSSIAGEVELSFTHALIREVAYSQLPARGAPSATNGAAGWLEQVATDRADTAELIAHHYTTALELETALGNDTETLRPAALGALADAARQAAARHDHTAVIRYTETALTLQPDPPLRAELLVLRRVAGYIAGHPDESVLLEARDAAVANGRAEDAVHLTCLLSANGPSTTPPTPNERSRTTPRHCDWRPTCLPARSPPFRPTSTPTASS